MVFHREVIGRGRGYRRDRRVGQTERKTIEFTVTIKWLMSKGMETLWLMSEGMLAGKRLRSTANLTENSYGGDLSDR